ncbi:hypothetical protein [aff. Roholtiella sp. LEGE 12411]|uniref:hypothetical protein n=1 Tax=aff. Roholtiella sp. LEGE 12411 TaxID=1828822 RepID=UPI0018806A7C|nr:hypothetical protein [aff. Roholtiella sp. LEGE 12411]MBE9037063.1 hypothetical protein [aff. Roholtiella sp. LEGE 12411]
MANIKLNDIKPAGTALFADSESFLNYLNDDEIGQVTGGLAANSGVSNSCTSGNCQTHAAFAAFV